jgi:putative PIN family toxin of toxin-antitoxin system
LVEVSDDVTRDIIQLVNIVLDTSVLIAALRSSTGAAAEVIRRVLWREITVLMDYKLACEYREVALRPQQLHAAGRSRAETTAILDALEALAEPVFVAFRHRPLSPDADDDLVLDVAINGNGASIVTNNTRHFREAAARFEIEVLTPAELLSKFRKGRQD